MKHTGPIIAGLLTALCLISSPASAGTWYVNGVTGHNTNTCTSPTNACKTIKHAISLASSGDSIKVAAALYQENLNIGISLKILGASAKTTIIDGQLLNTVVTVPTTATIVTISNLTIRGGLGYQGGGISNLGKLTVSSCIISDNTASSSRSADAGGGIDNTGTATIDRSTISNNVAETLATTRSAEGGGIGSGGTLRIRNSTVSGNVVFEPSGRAKIGAGIYVGGTLIASNLTVTGNQGPGVSIGLGAAAVVQNSIVSQNVGGNCDGSITSNGYNLSSDTTCNFSGPGDLNNIDPQLGPLQDNGGNTPTMALPSGSPAVDAGNPNGCRDEKGNLLKTDQRGQPRPDKEDTGGCDVGAYERQSD